MNYDINATLDILPWIIWVLLGASLIFLEIRSFREFCTEKNTDPPESGRESFTPPPGDGYEHYINSETVVYILHKGAMHYRVYLVRGDTPKAKVRRDRYGRYFKIRCPDEGRAEKIAENAFA